MQMIDRRTGRTIISKEHRARNVFHLLAATICHCMCVGAASALDLISRKTALVLIVVFAIPIGYASIQLSKSPLKPLAFWLVVSLWACILSYSFGLSFALGFAGLVGWPVLLFVVLGVGRHTGHIQ